MASEPSNNKDPLFALAKRLGLRSMTSTKYTRNRDQREGKTSPGPYLNLQRFFNLCYFNEPDSSNSRYVKIQSLGFRSTDEGNQAFSTTITRIPGEEPRIWDQTITALPVTYMGKINKAPGIKVYCACPRFQYMWDYALFTVGASDGLACQGIPAIETNPSNKIAGCKHLCRLAEVLMIRNK